jgi:cell division septation protein DedD
MADLPAWSAFEADAAPVLPEHAERPGRLVAVVATARAQEDGWAIDATVDIVKAWSESGRRVVLADTVLAGPTLHECLQTENGEGVTDTVLFGSSIRRVAKSTHEGAFFIITAGTATADPGAVLASERWKRLSRGFVEADVTLVTYIGAESEGKAAILKMASDVILLAGPTEDAWSALNGTSAPILAVTGPAPTAPSAVPPLEELPGALAPLEEVADGSAGDAEGSDDQHGGPPLNLSDSRLPVAEATIVGATRAGDAPVAARGSRRSVFLVLTIVLLGIVGAESFGWIDIPWISPEATPTPPEQNPTPVEPAVLRAVTTTTLGYSVTIGSFREPDVAATRAAAISGAEGIFFAVAPLMVDGTVFHRVLVGPAVDAASADALADRIAAETGADRSGWLVRETALAFLLGEMADVESATARVDELQGLDIPAYVLAIDYSDGSTAYRVYAGAYSDEREASYLLTHLESRGVDATLSARLGRIH